MASIKELSELVSFMKRFSFRIVIAVSGHLPHTPMLLYASCAFSNYA
jgi:hypothetical protein